jgi:hypothetical protein
LKVKNASTETMNGGKFELYYDNANEERNLVTSADVSTLAAGAEQTITFSLPDADDATSYMLIYKGPLGDEPNALIGKFILTKQAVIFVAIGSQCIVWEVAKKQLYDKVTTNSSTPEKPEYAVFPCDPATISTWRDKQITPTMYEINNLTMLSCGRINTPSNGAEGQTCNLALDAVGAIDTFSTTGGYDLGTETSLYNSARNLRETYTPYALLQSRNSPIEDLNSSIWYRVKWELQSAWEHNAGETSHWWGEAGSSSHDSQEKYSFYSVGEPFGIPFFVSEGYYNEVGEVYCRNHIDGDFSSGWPYVKERLTVVNQLPPWWNETSPNFKCRGSSMTTLVHSDKLIFHITHIAMIEKTESGSYDYDYEYWANGTGGSYPILSSESNRRQGLKVNLEYKKDGIGNTYNLGHIPVAPTNLKTAIQDLIDKMYVAAGIPETETTCKLPVGITFYDLIK